MRNGSGACIPTFSKWTILAVMCFAMASCHSHRNTVRGDQQSVSNSGKPTKTELKGDANNKFTRNLLDEAYAWIGTPYVYGGQSKKGADCSGFVMVLYRDILDIKLPRVSREQGVFCKEIKKSDLFPGDLVFFNTGSSKNVNHVGMYVGDNKIIHASSSKGIILSDLAVNYYVKHYHHSGQVEAYHKMVAAEVSKSGKKSEKKDKKAKKQDPKTKQPTKKKKQQEIKIPAKIGLETPVVSVSVDSLDKVISSEPALQE